MEKFVKLSINCRPNRILISKGDNVKKMEHSVNQLEEGEVFCTSPDIRDAVKEAQYDFLQSI